MEGPELDAAASQQVPEVRATDPVYDLRIASKNYWAARTGREYPPAPTYHNIGGNMVLGRYMDPYGAQCHLRDTRRLWDKWYTEFFICIALGLLFGPATDFISVVLGLALFAPWYFAVKAKHTRQYNQYFAIQEEALSTGEPVWVPYDKTRLKLIDKNPLAVWP